MRKESYHELFCEPQKPADLTLMSVVNWMRADTGGRLLLPPIQRSVVWTNEQIIHYWDSLLRGYPPGLMMVHPASNKGRDADGKTIETQKDDFQLFDGQQRMTAILLGFGMGQLKNNYKLWVDLNVDPNKNSDLKFQLRINSIGQPFGYKSEAPNQKIELNKRREKWKSWKQKKNGNINLIEVFKEVDGDDLIDAKCIVSLENILSSIVCLGRDQTIIELTSKKKGNDQRVDEFVDALKNALNSKIIFQKVSPDIVADQKEYIRFFTRLGQGGTRLSDDELTYSIIKYNYPEIHDRMKDIMSGDSGRIAGEVDLVLSALRVSKTLTPWEQAMEWEVIGRPSPAFVSQLKERKEVESKFLELIPQEQQNGLLKASLVNIRKGLDYAEITHPEGLPAMLLAQLPKELVDVLILFSCKRGVINSWDDEKANLRAFVQHWLFFIRDDAKAAWLVYQQVFKNTSNNDTNADWIFTQEFICNIIKDFEREGIAYTIPSSGEIPKLEAEVKNQDHFLLPWEDRFTALDRDTQHKPGDSLRTLSTNPKLIKRALMWLQRKYLSIEFPGYDPTSDRDEDLPVDLDHLIPHDLFGFNWNGCYRKLDEDIINDKDTSDNFWRFRNTIGNSLGNYRWLSSSDNRGRGKSFFTPLQNNGDLVVNHNDWNSLIKAQEDGNKWSKAHIAKFQQLIDLRTLALYKMMLTETGIENLLWKKAV